MLKAAMLATLQPLEAQVVPPVTDAFRAAGSIGEARSNHTATLLNDGRILIAGGITSSSGILSDLRSAILFDPGTGRGTSVGDLLLPRTDHTATLLQDGRVLIVGGRKNDGPNGRPKPLASAELYDPSTRTFTGTGTMHEARDWHAAVRLADGKVLVCGGLKNDQGSVSAEVYDPATGIFSRTRAMYLGRLGHTATLLQNGKVLVASESIAELYDSESGRFTKTGKLITPRLFHTATLLGDGTILLVGGVVQNEPLSSAELYTPATGTFIAVGSLKTARRGHTATLLEDGRVLIAGGVVAKGASSTDAELFDPVQRTFSLVTSSVTPRAYQAAVRMTGGTVFLIGGRTGGGGCLSSVEAFGAAK